MSEISAFNPTDPQGGAVNEKFVINHPQTISLLKTEEIDGPGIDLRQSHRQHWVYPAIRHGIP